MKMIAGAIVVFAAAVMLLATAIRYQGMGPAGSAEPFYIAVACATLLGGAHTIRVGAKDQNRS